MTEDHTQPNGTARREAALFEKKRRALLQRKAVSAVKSTFSLEDMEKFRNALETKPKMTWEEYFETLKHKGV